jgi:hypothetical protein
MDIRIIETVERSGVAIHKVTGTVNFGEIGETEYEIYDGTLTIGGGYVQLDVNVQNPLLL